jgi:hypothetical protein
MRRAWWAEELARAGMRQARHPVGLELQRLAANMQLDIPALHRFAATGGTLTERVAETQGAAGGLWEAAARACGLTGNRALDAVARAGELVDAVELLARAAAADAPTLAGQLGRGLDAASREMLERGAQRAEFCLIMARLAAVLCAELERDTGKSARARIALTPLHKLWIAWRIHRRHGG